MSQAFNPVQRAWSPSKDGFYSNTNIARRTIMLRILAGLFLIMVCYTLFAPSSTSGTSVAKSLDNLKVARHDMSSALPNLPAVAPVSGGSAYARGKQQAIKELPVEDDDDTVSASNARLSSSKSQEKKKKEPVGIKEENKNLDVAHFRAALDRVIDLIPDELRIADLMRPVTGTGEKMIRDLGLRSRALGKLFTAWEDLHLVHTEGGSALRSDVMQIIHSTKTEDETSRDIAAKVRSYEDFRHLFTKLSDILFPYFAPYAPDLVALHASFKRAGRGIVLTAGDSQAAYLMTTIPTFRKLGCDLPIEIMYLGEDDLSDDTRSRLERIPGVITRDLRQMVHDEGWALAGWAAKPFAILLSSFREVIFIDADSFFLVNPESLFSDPAYTSTGALFFKDRRIFPEDRRPFLKKLLPRPISENVQQSRFWTGESGHMQESGVVVVDKWLHFVPLLLITRMNGPDRDGNEAAGKRGVYDMVYGDKETFWLGFELAGDTKYAFHEGENGIMGRVENGTSSALVKQKEEDEKAEAVVGWGPQSYTMCAPQLVHLDLQGRPLWFNGWIAKNKFSDRRKQQVADLDAFMIEPADQRTPDHWQMGESNVVCLRADRAMAFTEGEREVLDMLIETARDNKALGPGAFKSVG